MVILIGNQKGGVGKSTLTLLLANYLTAVHKRRLTVLDMDEQQAINCRYQKAKILENSPPYEVVAADLTRLLSLQRILKENMSEIILIDLPAKMEDDGLISVIQSADLIICPFSYDEFSVNSTLLFAMVIGQINQQAPILFVPNRIKGVVNYETKKEVDQVLTRFGKIGISLTDRIDFQRVDTLHTPEALFPVVLPLLEIIYSSYITPHLAD